MTEQQTARQRPTVEEALATLREVSGPVRISEFRPCKMYAELVEPKPDHNNTLIRTNQRHGAAGDHGAFVRVEYAQVFTKDEEQKDGPDVSLAIGFGMVIAYEFSEVLPLETRVTYAQIMGIMNSWPYYRTFVHAAMTQMGTTGSISPLVTPPRAAAMAGFRETTPEKPE
jgi:hypothetical protein